MNEIVRILLTMLEYQKLNNIKGQCMTNVQYLLDTIKMNETDSKAKAMPVIALHRRGDEMLIVAHLVIALEDDKIIDPSYEISSLDDESTIYCSKISTVKEYLKSTNSDQAETNKTLKFATSKLIEFMKITDEMNRGEIRVSNKEYYNNQADYVESKLLGVGQKI